MSLGLSERYKSPLYKSERYESLLADLIYSRC